MEQSFRVAWNKVTLPQIFSAANLILVVTESERKAKIKLGAKPEKCFLFPGGVDDELLSYENVEVKSLLERLNKEKVKVISYLGSLEERKNPLAVLKVAKSLQERKDIHFVIAGRGDSAYAKKVVEMAKSLPNVTYLGEVSDMEKVQLIRISYLNILLSQLEALGLTQLEFMHFGVPVITSGVCGQGWLIRNGIEGIHVRGSEDVEGATKAITKLVENKPLWQQLSINAKNRVSDLALSTLISKLDEVLTHELLKERGLIQIPLEARATLEEPENVLKCWKFGGWEVVATKQRFFVKRGFISRKVTEIPHANVSTIEYTRRFPWKTLMAGAAFSVFFFIVPLLRPVFSRAFLGWLTPILESPVLASFFDVLPFIPMAISVAVFIFQARVGFTLKGPGIDSLYLPGKFVDAISFIRRMQNKKATKNENKISNILM